MYKDVARAIEGIDIYPAIGILIFFGVFMIVLITTYSAKKTSVQQWETLPLDDGTNAHSTNPQNQQNYEQQ